MMFGRIVAIAAVAMGSVAASSCPKVRNEGEAVGQIRNVSGTQIYISYPPASDKVVPTTKAILYVSDIYGLPLLQNKLLADSLASSNYLVVLPDLFRGDAIPVITPEPGLNLTAWRERHPPAEIDSIIAKTITYMKTELGVQRIGGVGYCFGGKFVPRALAVGKGLDAGFIAHPSGLETGEIRAVGGPLSIAAGELDAAFNATARRNAEDILSSRNATYQTTLYSQAPHGFAVRANMSMPQQKFAKEAAFLQAVQWFDAWL